MKRHGCYTWMHHDVALLQDWNSGPDTLAPPYFLLKNAYWCQKKCFRKTIFLLFHFLRIVSLATVGAVTCNLLDNL